VAYGTYNVMNQAIYAVAVDATDKKVTLSFENSQKVMKYHDYNNKNL